MWLPLVALFCTLLTFSSAFHLAGSDSATSRLAYVTHHHHKNESSLAPMDILSWKERFLLKHHSCTPWMQNSSTISEEAQKEMETLLKNENLIEYKKAVLAHAEAEPNAPVVISTTTECFNKLAIIGEKLERLNRARHKSVLRSSAHPVAHKNTHHRRQYDIERVLSHWQLRKLHSYLTKTGDSESIINALRHHFRQLPVTTQSHFIDEFFQYSPSLRRGGIHQREQRSVNHARTITHQRAYKPINLGTHPKDSPVQTWITFDGSLANMDSMNGEDWSQADNDKDRRLPIKYFNWLSADQFKTLSALLTIGIGRKMLLEKAYEYMLPLSGSHREEATRYLRRLCIDLEIDILGDERNAVFYRMHKMEMEDSNIDKTLSEIMSEVDDRHRQEYDQMAPICRLVFGFRNGPSRRIRKHSLDATHLYWLTTEQEEEIERMQRDGVSEPEVLAKLADFYLHLNSTMQKNVSTKLKPFCIEQIKRIVGDEGFNELRSAYEESGSIKQLTKKYMLLIGTLDSEQQRADAERVGLFCKKIFHLNKFDPAFLTAWLSAEQKRELQHIIQDPKIGDEAVYDRLFEFYEKTKGDRKNDAREVIESGCKWYIAHMLGEDIANSIEEQRLSGNFSGQMMSAKLVRHVTEIENERHRIKTQKTIPICKQIYLGYTGGCFCNGHSSTCDPTAHFCIGCADNTEGIECESCATGYIGSGLIDSNGCIEIPKNFSSNCNCHGHSSRCDQNGNCMDCESNTTGVHCENCVSGFYGDATQGTTEDCIKCPCPDGGECFVNEDSLLECRICRTNAPGTTCEGYNSTLATEVLHVN